MLPRQRHQRSTCRRPDDYAALTLISGWVVRAVRRIMSAPFSAIIMVGALVLADVTDDITEASEQAGFEPSVPLAEKVTSGIRYDELLLAQVSNATDHIRCGNLGVRPNRARRAIW